MTYALSAQGISKRYSATLALDDVVLEVGRGEIHGLLGHNGSGKSTLIKVLAGVVVPDEGQLTVGKRVAPLPLKPAESENLGLRFVHQNLGLIPTLTVGENLLLDRFTRDPRRHIKWGAFHRSANALLAEHQVSVDSRIQLSQISPAEQAQIAIVRALADRDTEPDAATRRVLILDEPTVFLPRKEVGDLFRLLRRLVEAGDSAILVSHRMDEVLSHTDRVTVLRDGKNVATVTTADSTEAELVSLIVGPSHGAPRTSSPSVGAAAVASAPHSGQAAIRSLSTDVARDVDMDLHAGEIVGLTGLVGSGYESVLYALFGCAVRGKGTLVIDQDTADLTKLTPVTAMGLGIGLIPADRGTRGIAPSMTIEENLTVTELDRYFKRGLLRASELVSAGMRAIDNYGIRPRDPSAMASQLSGGNQQRIVVAKWLGRSPRLLLLHEPTQGVDVGARAEIWSFIRGMADSGATVLCASTDHEELTDLSSRVAIFADGRLVRVLEGSEITKERISAETLSTTHHTRPEVA